MLPVWLLLQPRDYINSYQLYIALGLMLLGFVVSVYLFSQRKPIIYTVLPLIGMLFMVLWAMSRKLATFYHGWKANGDLGYASLFCVGLVLLVLTVWLVIEALGAFARWHRLRTTDQISPPAGA